MKHSILAWDSSYRYFYHLVDGMLSQEYDEEEFELIFVEQRSREFYEQHSRAATSAHSNVETLIERAEAIPNEELQLHVEFVGDDTNRPFHIGRCVNHGLDIATGEYISVMDGDQLLPSGFLHALDEFHDGTDTVANIVRRDVPKPYGVSEENWKDQQVDYQQCLDACPSKGDPIPQTASDYGPMISTHRDNWEAINGYSEHHIWSTGISKLGTDATRRLELVTGTQARPLPDTVAVHPWHAPGLHRGHLKFRRLFRLQQQLVDWAVENRVYNHSKRTPLAENLYQKHRDLINSVIRDSDLAVPGNADPDADTFWDRTIGRLELYAATVLYDNPLDVIELANNDFKSLLSEI